MTEREALRENIADEMRRLDDPNAIRDSFVIAQDYARRGYAVSIDSIQVIVREVARELRFLGVY